MAERKPAEKKNTIAGAEPPRGQRRSIRARERQEVFLPQLVTVPNDTKVETG